MKQEEITESISNFENSCEYCNDDLIPVLDWKYGLDHILPDWKYCPMCGRKVVNGIGNGIL